MSKPSGRSVRITILCLLAVVMSVFLMAQVAHAGGGFDYGLTVSQIPSGGQAKVSSTLGTTYDYGWSNLPASVSVTPWFTPRNPADPPAISSCDAFVYRNGAQWGSEPVSASPAQPFTLPMSPPVRWDVKIVCTYANAQPVTVTLVSQVAPPPPAPSAAAVAPKASPPTPTPATPTPKPAAASPVSKVVSAPAATVAAPRSSVPAAPAQVAAAPSASPQPSSVASPSDTPTPSVAPQVPAGTPIVEAGQAPRSVAAKAPVTPGHSGNPLRAILLGVVIALLLLVVVARIKGRRDPLAAYVQVEEAKEESE